MINQLSLSQLEHKAYAEDNQVALAILSKLDEEVEEAVELAATVNDADYSYTIFDAIQTVEFLISCIWYKLPKSKETKNRIMYMIKGLNEETSPHNNQVILFKYKASNIWCFKANAGQYGEYVQEHKFKATSFKEAQQLTISSLITLIKKGLELNI